MQTRKFRTNPDARLCSLEDFLLERLEMSAEQLENCSQAMVEMLTGGLMILELCLQEVKIVSRHDELAGALTKAVAALDTKSPDGAGIAMLVGLIALKKLEAEKNGEPMDWGYANKLGPDSPFLTEEIGRVWG